MAFNIWRSLHQSFRQKVEHFNISEGGMLKLESKSTKVKMLFSCEMECAITLLICLNK